MRVEVIFMSSSTPKVFDNATAVYTKDGFACIGYIDESGVDMILKYPLVNVFSVCHPHGPHGGTHTGK